MHLSYAVLLTLIILLVKSVTAQVDLDNEISGITRQTDTREKVASSVRFLRGGDTKDGAGNEVDNEEKGLVGDVAIKLGLKLSLKMNREPLHVLQHLQDSGNLMSEKILFAWLKYVLNYRQKMGYFMADDAYIVGTLEKFVSAEKLPALLKSMEKNSKLRTLGKNLQEILASKA
ncbi:unnamed protein product [Phytophthora lilii]|uniref:RxLR effector protein n=1 Tax=Phytophthora lilii TaxID=2077276 RepID=A0A9W6XH08_9STRA|nr:unnamed protein product [Phytophthora lilii]